MVSGASNTIVASRASKDLISSLCSGLLTIGDLFGGALNEAGTNFYYAFHIDKETPEPPVIVIVGVCVYPLPV